MTFQFGEPDVRRSLRSRRLAALFGVTAVAVVAACGRGEDELRGADLSYVSDVICGTPGVSRTCGIKAKQSVDYVICERGEQKCGDDGRWQDCIPSVPVSAYWRAVTGRGVSLAGLGAPTPCDNSPCDPKCAQYNDTLDGVDAGPGLAVVDSGLTLSETDATADSAAATCASCGAGGGVCTGGGVCCERDRVCNGLCCAAGSVCSFSGCVVPGTPCRERDDCGANEFCDIALAGTSGNDAGPTGACLTLANLGKCMPRPPECPSASSADAGVESANCVQKCQFRPTTTAFSPALKYSWGGETTAPYASDVMTTPIVTQLDDDDCDGVVTASDMPDIVFTTFPNGQFDGRGTLRAVSVKNGALQEKWSLPGEIAANASLASGNIDGLPGNEIVGCDAQGGGAVAVSGEGMVLWRSPGVACDSPALADMDHDGNVEVVLSGAIVDGRTGALLHHLAAPRSNVPVDIDGDGQLNVVGPDVVMGADGVVLAALPLTASPTYVAVGDLDLDGKPEIVGTDYAQHTVTIWRYIPAVGATPAHADVVRAAIDINEGFANTCPLRPAASPDGQYGGGPPTIGDFNADGFPDVAMAGSIGYVVYDGKKLMAPSAFNNLQAQLWRSPTQDCSSAATGSSLFDFDGDGRAEIAYSDELYLRIYDGPTGAEKFKTCNTTGTLVEYPVIADIDNDGQADMVVASNAYALTCEGTKQSGIRVYSSSSKDWVNTRRIWNQQAYSITNVEHDGTIPRSQLPNWSQLGLNNFRQNKQPGLEFAASDAVVSAEPACDGTDSVLITIRNLGEAPLPPGVAADVYVGERPSGTALGRVTTSRTLGLAQAQSFVLPVPVDAHSAYADLVVPSAVRECRIDNNEAQATSLRCVAACSSVYKRASFERDFTHNCSSGSHVRWTQFQTQSDIPPGAAVSIYVRAAETAAALGGAAEVLAGTVTQSGNGWGAPGNSFDVSAAVQTSGGRQNPKWVRVRMELIPTADGCVAPTLRWRQRFTCVDAE